MKNIEAVLSAMYHLDHMPDEVEVTLALKASGALSNIVVGTLGGEANYAMKMIWKNPASHR